MYFRVIALMLAAVIVWGVVQGARRRRASDFALAAVGSVLLFALATRHPLSYVAALAMLGLRWYLIWRERRLGG